MKYVLSISSLLRKLSALSWILVILDINGGNFKVKKKTCKFGDFWKNIGFDKTLIYNNTTRRSCCSSTSSQQRQRQRRRQLQLHCDSNSQLLLIIITTLITCLAIVIQHLSIQGNEEPFPSLLYYGTLLHDIFLSHIYEHQYNGISKIPRP